MDTTFRDEDVMWRAVESRTAAAIAYVAIIVRETLAAAVLLVAAFALIVVQLSAARGGQGREERH
ncbi:DUF2165 family protein [Streptomyces sp. NPDC094448]|uniref:DUF2165 family protein n=1 Tax=Streptomyces sp. NPDC094448 TaxID=3366063 RepID=UPI0037F7B14D